MALSARCSDGGHMRLLAQQGSTSAASASGTMPVPGDARLVGGWYPGSHRRDWPRALTRLASLAVGMVERLKVRVSGLSDGQPMLFAHGFGCDQNMWRYVAPHFESAFRVVLFDHVGAGQSDLTAYDPEHCPTGVTRARAVAQPRAALELTDVVFVGHS